eukprot:6184265-Pleurochrysis_carterae.AAC.1
MPCISKARACHRHVTVSSDPPPPKHFSHASLAAPCPSAYAGARPAALRGCAGATRDRAAQRARRCARARTALSRRSQTHPRLASSSSSARPAALTPSST